MTTKWGVPDWRDADSYPKSHESISDDQWKWEFLRRLPRYRSEWQNSYEGEVEGPTNYLPYPRPEFEKFMLFEVGMAVMLPPQIDGLCDALMNGAFHKFHSRIWKGESYDSRKKKILKKPEAEQLEAALGEIKELTEFFEFWEEGVCVAVFDVSLPIKDQLEAIEKLLLKRQQGLFPDMQQFKKSKPNWPRHIRVIDAKDQGATHAEIADQFVEEGYVDESVFYKARGSAKTQAARHKAIVSQWHRQAVEVMEKAARLL